MSKQKINLKQKKNKCLFALARHIAIWWRKLTYPAIIYKKSKAINVITPKLAVKIQTNQLFDCSCYSLFFVASNWPQQNEISFFSALDYPFELEIAFSHLKRIERRKNKNDATNISNYTFNDPFDATALTHNIKMLLSRPMYAPVVYASYFIIST